MAKKVYMGASATGEGIDANTLLVLHGENLADSSFNKVSITNNGVVASTAQSKFGGKSLYFNGTSSLRCSLPASGDITVDFWAYTTAFNTDYPTPFAWGAGSCRGSYMHICRASTEFGETGQNSSGDPSIAASAAAANSWHHFALVRTGGYTNGYIDGKFSGRLASQTTSNDTMILGYLPGVQDITWFTGYIDEFRVSSGARWKSDFNVPTKAYGATYTDAAREVTKPYLGESAVARKVISGYKGVGGAARQFWSTGTPLSSLAVGSTVYMKVNGVSKAFIVVNQGRPSSIYDSSCNGTWLLMKDIYESRVFYNSIKYMVDYSNSDIHSYLNNTFINLFDSGIQGAIKQVKLPYTNMTEGICTASNGVSARVFLLSYTEVGFSGQPNANVEGAVLGYFRGAANSRRIGYLNGSAAYWWLRSQAVNLSFAYAWRVSNTGNETYEYVTNPQGVRPCLVMPSDAIIDESYNVIAA